MGNCNMWASVAKNRENFDFLVKMFPYWTNPPSDFYNIKRGVGCRRSVPSRQISPMSLLKCGLTIPPKLLKLVICGINLPKNGISLKRYLKN